MFQKGIAVKKRNRDVTNVVSVEKKKKKKKRAENTPSLSPCNTRRQIKDKIPQLFIIISLMLSILGKKLSRHFEVFSYSFPEN